MPAERLIPEANWIVQAYPAEEDVDALRQHLRAYNVDRSGIDRGSGLSIFLRTAQAEMIAGISGWLWGACLEIDFLWIHEGLRGKGIGKRLVETLEREASTRGCQVVVLDTFSFQAPGFYENLGYELFGTVGGYGHQKLFFRKYL
jgi:GNAT superfamily N-acetyltransferase